jgi:hypothetical protein
MRQFFATFGEEIVLLWYSRFAAGVCVLATGLPACIDLRKRFNRHLIGVSDTCVASAYDSQHDGADSFESAPVPESARQSEQSKRRLIKWGLAVVVLVGGWFAWHQYSAYLEAEKTKQLSQSVEQSMQEEFDSDPSFSKYHIQVEKVGLIKESGNKYDGIATVRTLRSSNHDVAIEVTYDGSKIMWQSPPGALQFLAQEDVQTLTTPAP